MTAAEDYADVVQQYRALDPQAADPLLLGLAESIPDLDKRLTILRRSVEQLRERRGQEQQAAEQAAAEKQRREDEERALRVKAFGRSVDSPQAPVVPATTPQPASAPRCVVTPEAKARAKKLWRQGALRAAWKPRRRGKANEEVQPVFTMFPKYVTAPVRAAMSKSTLLAYLACLDEADLDGRFEMPAGQLGTLIGMNRRNAQIALYTLVDAGLVHVFLAGGPKKPNVYGLTPFRDFDEARAITALDQHRQARLPALQALREKQEAAALAS